MVQIRDGTGMFAPPPPPDPKTGEENGKPQISRTPLFGHNLEGLSASQRMFMAAMYLRDAKIGKDTRSYKRTYKAARLRNFYYKSYVKTLRWVAHVVLLLSFLWESPLECSKTGLSIDFSLSQTGTIMADYLVDKSCVNITSSPAHVVVIEILCLLTIIGMVALQWAYKGCQGFQDDRVIIMKTLILGGYVINCLSVLILPGYYLGLWTFRALLRGGLVFSDRQTVAIFFQIVKTIRALAPAIGLYVVAIVISASIGTVLYGDFDSMKHLSTSYESLHSFFELTNMGNTPDVFIPVYGASPLHVLYFIFIIIIFCFVFLNVLMVVVYDAFVSHMKQKKMIRARTKLLLIDMAFELMDQDGSGELTLDEFVLAAPFLFTEKTQQNVLEVFSELLAKKESDRKDGLMGGANVHEDHGARDNHNKGSTKERFLDKHAFMSILEYIGIDIIQEHILDYDSDHEYAAPELVSESALETFHSNRMSPKNSLSPKSHAGSLPPIITPKPKENTFSFMRVNTHSIKQAKALEDRQHWMNTELEKLTLERHKRRLKQAKKKYSQSMGTASEQKSSADKTSADVARKSSRDSKKNPEWFVKIRQQHTKRKKARCWRSCVRDFLLLRAMRSHLGLVELIAAVVIVVSVLLYFAITPSISWFGMNTDTLSVFEREQLVFRLEIIYACVQWLEVLFKALSWRWWPKALKIQHAQKHNVMFIMDIASATVCAVLLCTGVAAGSDIPELDSHTIRQWDLVWAIKFCVSIRVLRLARLFLFNKSCSDIIVYSWNVLSMLGPPVLVLCLWCYSFAVMGVYFFGGLIVHDNLASMTKVGVPASYIFMNFNDPTHSIVTLFCIMLENNFTEIIKAPVTLAGGWYKVFFIFFSIGSVRIMINIVVALFLDSYFIIKQLMEKEKQKMELAILNESRKKLMLQSNFLEDDPETNREGESDGGAGRPRHRKRLKKVGKGKLTLEQAMSMHKLQIAMGSPAHRMGTLTFFKTQSMDEQSKLLMGSSTTKKQRRLARSPPGKLSKQATSLGSIDEVSKEDQSQGTKMLPNQVVEER